MIAEYFYVFIAAFVRLAPLILVAPLTIFTHIPLQVRTIIVAGFALICAATLVPGQFSGDHTLSVLMIIGELAIGFVLAASFHIANATLHMMSQLIDVQMGVSAGATFDPVNYHTSGPTGTLLGLIFVAVFFSTPLHYNFIFGFVEFFRVVPPGTELSLHAGFFAQLGKVMVLGFLLVGPVIIALFFTDVTLAMISRSMPQAQVYFVALPLKIFIGISVLAMTLGLSHRYFYNLIFEALRTWNTI